MKTFVTALIFVALGPILAVSASQIQPDRGHHELLPKIIHYQQWYWPMDSYQRSSVVQAFGEYNACVAACSYHQTYHSGLDIGAPQGTDVKAAADGYVVNVIPNGCDTNGCWDHGDGNTIIIAHKGGVYSHYQHLHGLEENLKTYVETYCPPYGPGKDGNGVYVFGYLCPSTAYFVSRGTVIGYVGDTGEGKEGTAYHLHFEAKTFPTLYSYNCYNDKTNCCPPDNNGIRHCFGYTTAYPFRDVGCKSRSCEYGYLDPVNWVEAGAKHVRPNILVGPPTQTVNLRIGPNVGYDKQTVWQPSGPAYYAILKIPSIAGDGCGQDWYKVIKNNSEGWPPEKQYYFDATDATRPGPGKLAAVWVCSAYLAPG